MASRGAPAAAGGAVASAGAGNSSSTATGEPARYSWEYNLRKYLMLLATVVATVTYTAGFNPPGGVWQDTDPAAGRLAGDPIIRDTSYRRYLAFFYTNATAFASSLVVIVLILIMAIFEEKNKASLAPLRILRSVMVLDLLSLVAAYAAGTCRDVLTVVYSLALGLLVVVYVIVRMIWAASTETNPDEKNEEHLELAKDLQKQRKMLMLLATFAVSVTYLAGLSAPGGFWNNSDGGHRAGEAVLKGRHDARLKTFFVFNTTGFIASLLVIVLLLDRKLRLNLNQQERAGTPAGLAVAPPVLEEDKKWFPRRLYAIIILVLIGLIGAYSAGSCRELGTSIYVNALVGAVLVCIALQLFVVRKYWDKLVRFYNRALKWLTERWQLCLGHHGPPTPQPDTNNPFSKKKTEPETVRDEQPGKQPTEALEKARSLVLLLATLAATITYQAGLDPPGGLWEDDGEGYMAGDPILLTINPRRYKAFFYCNSVAFVASLVAIILVRYDTLHKHNSLEAAMILDLFGLMGAYAAGSCRDLTTSIYAVALAGAVLVYVVIHIVFFTLDHEDDNNKAKKTEQEDDDSLEKRRKRQLLFAILAATITYQAGLTPPGGFRPRGDESGHNAGDPVLHYNFPRRYNAFFYCNSISFMLSMALIILLVNKNLYRPAIRSNAVSVCMAVGMISLVGAYAAGSTQHLRTSIYIFALAAVVLLCVAGLVLVFWFINNSRSGDEESGRKEDTGTENSEIKDKVHAKRKYLMLLGILVASVTYQAGLEPPGGFWQSEGAGHVAGDPIMRYNRRPRYRAFFYSNSTSFVASVVVIILLLLESLKQEKKEWPFRAMNMTIVLDLLGLLVAYAVGSSRSCGTTGYVFALVVTVLAYVVLHVVVSYNMKKPKNTKQLRHGGHLQGNV